MTSSDTQDQILDAVQSVIVREGVRGASMRNVAEEADVSVGLLSYHFDDKQSLIVAAFDRATTGLLAASTASAAAVDGSEEKVKAFLRGGFTEDFLNGDYLRLRISLWAVALTDPAVSRLDVEFYGTYTTMWKEMVAMARPDLTDDEVAARVTDAITTSNGVWLNWARSQNEVDLERGLRLSEEIVLR